MRILLANLMRRVIAPASCLKNAEEVEENVWFDLGFERGHLAKLTGNRPSEKKNATRVMEDSCENNVLCNKAENYGWINITCDRSTN